MKRVAVFAHYDKNCVIEEFVKLYLKGLTTVADKIIFVSDCDLGNEELSKIEQYTSHIIAQKHGEYDFGSYKRGFLYAKQAGYLDDCEELIFANDSCYAPLYPFEEMFNKMSVSNVDFWGATINLEGVDIINGEIKAVDKKHVQSYFLVFKPKVFNSSVFNNFIESIQKQSSKFEIIYKYEVGLTDLLEKNGFSYDAYSEFSKKIDNAYLVKYREMIKEEKMPFLKRSLPLYRTIGFVCPIFIGHLVNRYTKYPFSVIREDIKNNAEKVSRFKLIIMILKIYRKKLISVRLNARKQEICIFNKTLDLSFIMKKGSKTRV